MNHEVATFAGGCFWCIEAAFAEVPGVINVVPGYMGGETKNPTSEEVYSGMTGHFEVAQVTFDPEAVSYKELLTIFWQQIDPADPDGQFADRGPEYRTAIFYYNTEQRKLAEKSKRKLEKSGKFTELIVTLILPASEFYEAEDYHKEYYKKYPERYRLYKIGSGREGFIRKTWK